MNLSIKFFKSGWAKFSINGNIQDISALTGFSRCTKSIGLSLDEALQAVKAGKEYKLITWCEGADLIIDFVPSISSYNVVAEIQDEDKPHRIYEAICNELIEKQELEVLLKNLIDSINMEEYQVYLQYNEL